MTAAEVCGDMSAITPEFRRRLLGLLICLGLITLAAVQPQRQERSQCGPFRIGVSAVGGCDRIGR